MSYLEDVQLRGRDANPFFCFMAIDINSFGDGEAQLSMEVRPRYPMEWGGFKEDSSQKAV